MDLQTFRRTVTSYQSGIPDIANDLTALYSYVGLPIENNLTRQLVTEALYGKIRNTFTSGHGAAFRQCCNWLDELIQTGASPNLADGYMFPEEHPSNLRIHDHGNHLFIPPA